MAVPRASSVTLVYRPLMLQITGTIAISLKVILVLVARLMNWVGIPMEWAGRLVVVVVGLTVGVLGGKAIKLVIRAELCV